MSKRRHPKDDYEEISKKIRRLERKLLRTRARETRQPSPEMSRSSSYSSEYNIDEDHYEDQVTPLDDFYDEVLGTEELLDKSSSEKLPSVVVKCPQPQAPLESSPVAEQPPAHDQQSAEDAVTEPVVDQNIEHPLDKEILEILGEDLSVTAIYGKDIHSELANRLQHILVNGLTKDMWKEITSKYLVPAKCTIIAAPELNLEIKAAFPEMSLKRDKAMESRQKQLASAISCLTEFISDQLHTKAKNNPLLKHLMDATRILCDLQHGDSIKRRYFASSSLKKDITDQLIPTKVDKYLFGDNLSERLKAAKAISKSGAEIKVDKNAKKAPQPQPSTPKNSLNWKARGTSRKPPAPQNNRQPASARVRPESSSKPSQRQPPSLKRSHRR